MAFGGVDMGSKEIQFAMEREYFSPFATLSENTRGRQVLEEPCPLRTEYQRDRDRILHCSAFRRLKHKTQVFLAPQGDHYRTRLTHTLEVSQIARTIARALQLNEDLTEAIALGHDLGHTPFGHAGERVLDRICPFPFYHHLQSVRVVDKLEKDGKGLNLTYEVRNGIACHSSGGNDKARAVTMEGRIVRISDKIAYINHDIEDAVRAEVLSETDLPWQAVYTLGRNKSERLTTMITSIVKNSKEDVQMAPEVLAAHHMLRDFMFENVYTNPVAKSQENKAEALLENLYQYYWNHLEKLPEFYQSLLERASSERVICDYIAGMTDQYAVSQYEQLFIPKFWSKE
ncbi:MAG: deoxyguanosinetriphosphate triphosphohydrolase [Oscillospiraceae bacterium]